LRKQIPWLRILVEAAVIVGSILLAFGIEAWWAGVGEQERERGYLLSLREEFGEVLSQLAVVEAERGLALHGVESLIGQIQGDQRAPTDSLFMWFSLTSMPVSLDPPRGVFDDAAASGVIQLIQLDKLRVALAQYGPSLARVRVQDEAASAVTELRLQPFLEARVPRSERIRRGLVGIDPSIYDELPFRESPHAVDFDAVFAEPALESMLAERWARLSFGLGHLEDTEALVRGIISLIDSELGAPESGGG
jgi:hypothetical protein